jgi:multiple sugar transport system permease protein
MTSVIVVQIWKLYPIMFITLLAALQGVPKELHEAAKIDGANVVQRFVYVTFPFIRGTSVIITLLAAIWTFQNFDIIYLLTGGGPAGATKILPTLVYEKGFWAGELGHAAAVGIVILLCLLILSVAYLLAYSAQKERTA